MVYGINFDRMNCDKLFNLFCLYGNVVKVALKEFSLFSPLHFLTSPPCSLHFCSQTGNLSLNFTIPSSLEFKAA